MDPLTREGAAKIIPTCTYPADLRRLVSRVYTDLAVFHLVEAMSCCATLLGLDLVELQKLVPMSLVDGSRTS